MLVLKPGRTKWLCTKYCCNCFLGDHKRATLCHKLDLLLQCNTLSETWKFLFQLWVQITSQQQNRMTAILLSFLSHRNSIFDWSWLERHYQHLLDLNWLVDNFIGSFTFAITRVDVTHSSNITGCLLGTDFAATLRFCALYLDVLTDVLSSMLARSCHPTKVRWTRLKFFSICANGQLVRKLSSQSSPQSWLTEMVRSRDCTISTALHWPV